MVPAGEPAGTTLTVHTDQRLGGPPTPAPLTDRVRRGCVVGSEDVAAEVAPGAPQDRVRVPVAIGGLVELDQQVIALNPVVVPQSGQVRALPREMQVVGLQALG